jgi:hypothetical protein
MVGAVLQLEFSERIILRTLASDPHSEIPIDRQVTLEVGFL